MAKFGRRVIAWHFILIRIQLRECPLAIGIFSLVVPKFVEQE